MPTPRRQQYQRPLMLFADIQEEFAAGRRDLKCVAHIHRNRAAG